MRKFISTALAATALAVPAAASAAPNPAAQCGTGAGSAAAGYFGAHGAPGYHDMGQNQGQQPVGGTLGANGPQTGLNNSAVCGNR